MKDTKVNLNDLLALYNLIDCIDSINIDNLSFRMKCTIQNISQSLLRHIEEDTDLPELLKQYGKRMENHE